MATEDGSKIGAEDIRCGFYVQRKRRHCRMIPAKGNRYCAEHLCHQQPSIDISPDEFGKEIQDCCNVCIHLHLHLIESTFGSFSTKYLSEMAALSAKVSYRNLLLVL